MEKATVEQIAKVEEGSGCETLNASPEAAEESSDAMVTDDMLLEEPCPSLPNAVKVFTATAGEVQDMDDPILEEGNDKQGRSYMACRPNSALQQLEAK